MTGWPLWPSGSNCDQVVLPSVPKRTPGSGLRVRAEPWRLLTSRVGRRADAGCGAETAKGWVGWGVIERDKAEASRPISLICRRAGGPEIGSLKPNGALLGR